MLSELAETRTNISSSLVQNPNTTEFKQINKSQNMVSNIASRIIKKSEELQKWRKNRTKKPEGLASIQHISEIKEISSNILHSSSQPGISSVSIDSHNTNIVFTGGFDGQIIRWNRQMKKVQNTLKKHSKKITVLKSHKEQSILLSGSYDQTVGIWTCQENHNWKLSNHLNYYDGPVNDIDIHPIGDYFVSCSDDGKWSLSNLEEGKKIHSVSVDNCKRVTSSQLHPDGRLLGTTDDSNNIRIWELHNYNNLISLDQNNTEVTSLSFSQNGYHLAMSNLDGVVKIYDLRKVSILYTFPSQDKIINKVQYDQSGQYLLMGGSEIWVYQTKSWDKCLLNIKSDSKDITDISWFPHAAGFVSVSKDRSLKFFTF
jgi:pre-mRNA-processing factor 19